MVRWWFFALGGKPSPFLSSALLIFTFIALILVFVHWFDTVYACLSCVVVFVAVECVFFASAVVKMCAYGRGRGRGRDHMTDLSTLCVLLYSSLFIRLIGGFSFIRSFVRSYVLFTYIDMFLLGPIFFRFFLLPILCASSNAFSAYFRLWCAHCICCLVFNCCVDVMQTNTNFVVIKAKLVIIRWCDEWQRFRNALNRETDHWIHICIYILLYGRCKDETISI